MKPTKRDQVEGEIREAGEWAYGYGKRLDSTWLAHEIVGHREVDDVDRIRLFERVRSKIRQYRWREKLPLPGYERLQRIYDVKHGNRRMFVPIHSLTRDEVLAKVVELKRMAHGCQRHAEELLRYFELGSEVAEMLDPKG